MYRYEGNRIRWEEIITILKCQCGYENDTNKWGLITDMNYYPGEDSFVASRKMLMHISLFSCPKCGLVYNQLNELNNK
jgi:hypothetical protein